MTRPLWFDRGLDVSAVAARLDEMALLPGPLQFSAVALPAEAQAGILHQAALARARRQLAQSHGEADRILAQEVRAVDDLVRTANLLVERLREWYALHAPEATRLVVDPNELAHLVAERGERHAVLAAIDQAKLAESSLGSDLGPADMAAVRSFAAALVAVHDAWKGLEERVQSLMKEIAPNLESVAGPVIGARLVALAGGLERLASWPAGTVQLLGAETALFRHIKEGSRPPKHGVLFQHPLVHQAPAWQRGPMARALANVASLAAKADGLTKRDLREHLRLQLDKQTERIRRERTKPRFGRERPMLVRAGRPATRSWAPERRDAPRFPPRQEGRTFPPREGQRTFPPRSGPPSRGPPSRGPPEGRSGPPDRRGPPDGRFPGGSAGPRQGWRKPQGAFRHPNKPAAPPGRAKREP
ncbi:MAG: NOP5/NOP56 family protein [Thermoplasmatota archaeon]